MDLIPASYRNYIAQLRIARMWAKTASCIAVTALSISLAFHMLNTDYVSEISILEKQKAISSHQRGILETLQSEFQTLEDKRKMLVKLRGGTAASEMFVNIDRSFEGRKIWFTSWEYNRAGSRTNEKAEEVNTGYFIIVKHDNERNTDETWKIQTHMEIEGKALDHEALSAFIRKLIRQPQIHDVRVLNTQSGSNRLVNFSIVVMVNSGMNSA